MFFCATLIVYNKWERLFLRIGLTKNLNLETVGFVGSWICGRKKTKANPENVGGLGGYLGIPLPKKIGRAPKRSSSNHPFPGASC